MGTEIERKFLVSGDGWRGRAEGVFYRQGYLSAEPERTVRVRIAGDRAFLTIKGRGVGISRPEFEYEIPIEDARELLDELCHTPLIEKHRYTFEFGGLHWEIDEFHGLNEGLILAEVELESETQKIVKPPWIGKEVSRDPRYFNAALVSNPYSTW